MKQAEQKNENEQLPVHHISDAPLSVAQVYELAQSNTQLVLSPAATKKIETCRQYLDDKIAHSDAAFYGINTGFGSLCNVRISKGGLEELQRNLLMSHACGMGEEVPQEVVKLMLLLKIQSLSYGHSGVQVLTVQRLIDFYNHNILPVVFQQGSLGASGDLAPLSHLALPLLGLGEVYHNGKRKKAKSVLKSFKWKPINLRSKEGLALINGTQFMSAYSVWCTHQAQYLAKVADFITALSVDAYNAHPIPFNPLIHQVRKQTGQIKVAARIRDYLAGSQICQQPKAHVQDPYSFRCVPQVHGASADAIQYVHDVIEREINAVTDNPNVFVDEDLILSGGNFHGQPLAMVLDFLSIALAEIGSISERRTFKLLDGTRDMPFFLAHQPGLHSALMIPQYTAASIVSQNKQLCTPAVIDSITSSNGQEDHVSMGANAATKCYRVLNNLRNILAVELLTATQALHFRKHKAKPPLQSSPLIEQVLTAYRNKVPFIKQDRVLHEDMVKSAAFIKEELRGML